MSASELLFKLDFVYGDQGDPEVNRRFEEVVDADDLVEFKGDLKKQCVVMMGLPAAGKSYFIKNEGQKYVAGFKGYKTLNSDVQLKFEQYKKAKADFALLSGAKSEAEYEEIARDLWYMGNDKKRHEFPIPYDWFRQFKNFTEFFRVTFKRYYAIYFDQLRLLATATDKKLFKDKIIKSGRILVIDTTGASTEKILKRLEEAKKLDYQVTIIYLEIPIDNSIARDIKRGQSNGRTVGVDVIKGYGARMTGAWVTYQTAAEKGGPIDRMFHLKWVQTGSGLYDGHFKKVSSRQYDVERDIEALKRDKALADKQTAYAEQ